jgi:HSP20 family protein
LHTLSTLCSIDFELRHTFSSRASRPTAPAKRAAANIADTGIERVEMQLERPNFRNHARESRFTGNFGTEFYPFIYLGVFSMTVVRYEPWALVSRLQKEVDRLFGAPLSTAADSGAWLPPVDIHEEANQFVLHVDLPGVDPKGVEITSDQGVLTIRGQRDSAHKESREGFRRIERISGEFQRRFSLPESADAQNIKAKVAHGVLEVAIPKLAQVQPHKITVEAA